MDFLYFKYLQPAWILDFFFGLALGLDTTVLLSWAGGEVKTIPIFCLGSTPSTGFWGVSAQTTRSIWIMECKALNSAWTPIHSKLLLFTDIPHLLRTNELFQELSSSVQSKLQNKGTRPPGQVNIFLKWKFKLYMHFVSIFWCTLHTQCREVARIYTGVWKKLPVFLWFCPVFLWHRALFLSLTRD